MNLESALKRICDLQPAYTSQNSEAMQERGRLIRRDVPDALRRHAAELRRALGDFGADFEVEGSDGIGRKTQAAWVRFHSESMSPNARTGYYVVIHFAADGSALYVTVGCGSTLLIKGDLKSLEDDALAAKTAWARDVIRRRLGDLEPFVDRIELGAKHRLPQTFEKATAVAKKVPRDSIDEAGIMALAVRAAEMLRALYEAQRTGGDLPADSVLTLEADALANPARSARSGQGFGLTPAERIAVDTHAMRTARLWLLDRGYRVIDRHKDNPFDLEAHRGDEVWKIEVKGTTGKGADAIIMTHNEVELHRREAGRTALLVVHGIELQRDGEKVEGRGGEAVLELPWDISAWDAVPINYRVVRRGA
jgi:hypothetical protein